MNLKRQLGAAPAGAPPAQPLPLLQRRLWRSLAHETDEEDLYHESICDDWGKRSGMWLFESRESSSLRSRRLFLSPRVSRALRLSSQHWPLDIFRLLFDGQVGLWSGSRLDYSHYVHHAAWLRRGFHKAEVQTLPGAASHATGAQGLVSRWPPGGHDDRLPEREPSHRPGRWRRSECHDPGGSPADPFRTAGSRLESAATLRGLPWSMLRVSRAMSATLIDSIQACREGGKAAHSNTIQYNLSLCTLSPMLVTPEEFGLCVYAAWPFLACNCTALR